MFVDLIADDAEKNSSSNNVPNNSSEFCPIIYFMILKTLIPTVYPWNFKQDPFLKGKTCSFGYFSLKWL